MKLVFIITLTLMLSSCATGKKNIYGCCIGQGVNGNKNYVSVSNVWNEADALPLAEEHCAKYGRSATYKEMKNYRAIFDCVE